MSKTTENVLLVPGESGWEIWTGQPETGFSQQQATETLLAGDLKDIPQGDITLLFPVKALTAVPMRVASDDDALFPDLAALHAERLGLRTDAMAGQLTDVFVVEREGENTTLVSVFLRTPAEGELPVRGPKAFDISPRAIPVTGDALATWREFGRWVFAVYHQGKLVYCQATAGDSRHPDDALAREIRLSLIQLSMQGLTIEPTRVILWSSNESVDASALRAAFTAPVEVQPRPAPVLPVPLSKLLPADVRAARRAAVRKRNITLAVAAVALLYLGVLGWFGYGLWKISAETKDLNARAEEAAPEGAEYATHIAKWDELAHAIDLQHSPVDILNRIANCIPPNSGLRLKVAEISATEIKLQGEAPQYQAVTTFSLKLSKHNELTNYTWQTPEPNQSTRGWEFVFTGEVPIVESQP
ncbi:MAG: hypothetical protein MUF13_09280 [Akkermansiaceae bacterium]|nr:hypothetical protein [Akkermansiaceae bacterium]